MDSSANLIGRCANLSSWMQATSNMHDATTLRLESLGVGCPLRKRPTSAGASYPWQVSPGCAEVFCDRVLSFCSAPRRRSPTRINHGGLGAPGEQT